MAVTFRNEIKISRESIQAFLNDTEGPVARRLLVVAEAIKQETLRTLKPGFPSSYLGPKIVKRMVMESNGPHVLVGAADVKTRAHVITGNPTLAFVWKRAGGLVFFRSVNHPGSDFTQYLTKRLLESAQVVGAAKI